MINRQMITPDDFYGYLDTIESGRASKLEILLPLRIRDELFLGNITHYDLLINFFSINYDLTSIDLDVTADGVLILRRYHIPKGSGISDLRGDIDG